jgi:ELWxxDGT repeat protein
MISRAQNFNLLDINKSKDSHPSNRSLFDGQQYDFVYGKFEYAVLNGIAYFTADDGIHGQELWRSDATPQGTKMVKDINPGAASSNVRAITASGDKIFFRADNGINGSEIWVSDGTNAGTFMLADISPFGSSSPSYLTDVKGKLYFFADYNATADQLWKTDGTSTGTKMVADFFSSEFGYSAGANQLMNVNGRVFFRLNRNGYPDLYTSNGTAAGTHLVKAINPYEGSSPSYLTALNGLLYFSADDGTGRHLWISDGTEAGTRMANNANNITVDDNIFFPFTIKGNNLYFPGYSNDGDGEKFCTYNTSNAANNVKVVKDINPGYYSYNLYNIVNVKGTLFITVNNGIDQVLWKSDGTTAGTVQVKDINPGGRNIYLYTDFVNANGMLLFSFYDDAHGYEVWKSDGTEAGTVMVKEINPGVFSSQAANITYIGNGISLFEATDGKTGLELWRTDGTEDGTTLVKNINQSSSGSSYPYWLIPNPDSSKLFFIAYEPQHGTELRITDGTALNTHIAKDIFAGSVGSNPGQPINFKNKTYFFADVLDTSNHTTSDIRTIRKLCKTNGTQAGTFALSIPALENVLNNANSYVSSMEAASNFLYLLIFNYSTYQFELWRSDGTAAGTYSIKTDIYPYNQVFIKAVGNTLFFTNYDFNYGVELWKTNGSAAGTLVKDIYAGFSSSNPYNLTSFNGKLYFTADYGYGPFVFTSDGTEAGTKVLNPIIQTFSAFGLANNKLFFSAYKTIGKGSELYAIDVNSDKPYLVKDINNGPASSNIFNFINADTLVYFIANDDKRGLGLWRSNGTNEGTNFIHNTDISDFSNVTTLHNKLFFTWNDTLWQSDGTKKGTKKIDDVNLEGVSNISNLTAFGNKIVFSAYAPATGLELYVSDAISEAFKANAITDASVKKPDALTFNATIFPNPAGTKASINITGTVKNVAVTITDISGKVLWQSNYSNQLLINLPIEKLQAGLYMVVIKNGNESKTLKLVKE